MENWTLTPYFRNMPLAAAWEGDFSLLSMAGMPPRQLVYLSDVCRDGPKSIIGMYEFLSKDDSLFHAIYGTGYILNLQHMYKYPFVAEKTIPNGVKEVVGPIGTMTSRYHRENLQQHASIVAANLVDAGMNKTTAALLAVLHDVGKKYTFATNKSGEICNYNHGELSAFIAGHWLRKLIDEETAKVIVATIYGHMLPHNSWNVSTHWRTGEPVNYRRDFFHQLLRFYRKDIVVSNSIMSMIDLFATCDRGVTEFTPGVMNRIERGRALICG